ncbi:hypothetical protein J6590_020726 [Homalodisca vitripennis]|nr:hypothetical protein J6590_020726 [Homalodisca vitripennis]
MCRLDWWLYLGQRREMLFNFLTSSPKHSLRRVNTLTDTTPPPPPSFGKDKKSEPFQLPLCSSRSEQTSNLQPFHRPLLSARNTSLPFRGPALEQPFTMSKRAVLVYGNL